MEPIVPTSSRTPSPRPILDAAVAEQLSALLRRSADALPGAPAIVVRCTASPVVLSSQPRPADIVDTVRAPWQDCLRTGVAIDELVADGPAGWLRAAGVGAVWCRPSRDAGEIVAVAIAFVPEARRPRSEEQRRLEQLADEVSLALGGDPGLRLLFDPLTDAATTERLQRLADERTAAAAIAHLDIDGLDAVNERYGPGGGDAVLVEVAARLRRVTRGSDVVVRTGADEFVLVLRDAAEIASIQIAARVLDELALPYEITTSGGDTVLASVTAGIGLCLQEDGTSFVDALRAASGALSDAKRIGRDRLHIVSC